MLSFSLPLIKCRALNSDDDDASYSSEIVQRLSNEISSLLSVHPLNLDRMKQGKPVANTILFRGCSRAPKLDDFDSNNHVIWNPTMMARTCIISGIGYGLGFKLISSAGDEHESESTSSILRDMNVFLSDFGKNQNCKFGFFHIKAVDEASHDHDFIHKINLIEGIDNIMSLIIENLIKEFKSDEFRILITGDHTTLCRIGEHSCEPVPFLLSGPLSHATLISSPAKYNVKLSECFLNNNLGRFSGKSVIEFLKLVMNK